MIIEMSIMYVSVLGDKLKELIHKKNTANYTFINNWGKESTVQLQQQQQQKEQQEKLQQQQ